MNNALAKLGFTYAEQALRRNVDAADHGIALGDLTVSATYRSREDGLEISLAKDEAVIDLSPRQARDASEVLAGMIACDLKTDPDPLRALIASRAEMVQVLREVVSIIAEWGGDVPQKEIAQELARRIDPILAKFPVTP